MHEMEPASLSTVERTNALEVCCCQEGSSDNSTHGRCNLWLKKSRVKFCLAVVNSKRILEEKDDLACSK